MTVKSSSALWSVPLAVALLAGTMCSQNPPAAKGTAQEPDKAADAAAVLAEMQQQFQKEHIGFDAKAQTVTIPAVVNRAEDPIEYLLVWRRGKRHEAVFWTSTKPSVLNAALLLLGLEPGKNADFREKDPAPTLEEIERGADPLIVDPPKGNPLWMTVRWKGADDKPVEHCVEDLLFDLTTQAPLGECAWVYLGGRMESLYRGEPPQFVADFEGNLVSVCYLTPANHLATMAHERSRDDQNWLTTPILPEPGTEVEFVFHKTEPPIHVERMKRLRAEQAQQEPGKVEPGKVPGGEPKKDGPPRKEPGR